MIVHDRDGPQLPAAMPRGFLELLEKRVGMCGRQRERRSFHPLARRLFQARHVFVTRRAGNVVRDAL